MATNASPGMSKHADTIRHLLNAHGRDEHFSALDALLAEREGFITERIYFDQVAERLRAERQQAVDALREIILLNDMGTGSIRHASRVARAALVKLGEKP